MSFISFCDAAAEIIHAHAPTRQTAPQIDSVLETFLFLSSSYKFAHNEVLALESLLPAPQALKLLLAEAVERVQRAVEVLGEHLLVKAVASQAPARVAASKVLVGAAGAVKVAPGRDVKHAATDGQVDGGAVHAIVGQQGARRERLEDGGRGLAGQRRGRRGLVQEVGRVEGDGGQNQVEGCDHAGAVHGREAPALLA